MILLSPDNPTIRGFSTPLPTYLLHCGDERAQCEVVNPLDEVHVVRVRAEEDWSHGEGRGIPCHSDVAQIISDRVDVHVRGLGRVHKCKGTVGISAVQDEQIEFAR